MKTALQKRIKIITWFFIISLIISGITAFAVETELHYLLRFKAYMPDKLYQWLETVYVAIFETNAKYPMLAYGFDWLAFAHIVIAIAFVGILREPVRNIWIIEFGMIACVLIIPLALICGAIRAIPFWWQMIDCSFGVFGILPLLYLHKLIKKLQQIS
jgi:hypothetical protein